MPHREARRNMRHSNQKGSPTKPPRWVTLFVRKTWRTWSLSKKPKKNAKKVIQELNMNKKINQNSSRSSSTCQGYFAVWCFSLPHAGGEEGFMTKPEKSELICVPEEKLESEDYSYHHQPGSAFLIDIIATVYRIPLVGLLCLPNSQRWLAYLWMLWLLLWYLWWYPISKGQWRVVESKCSSSGTEFSWTDNSTP